MISEEIAIIVFLFFLYFDQINTALMGVRESINNRSIIY